LAESALGWWTRSSGLETIDRMLKILRPKYDDLLKIHLLLLKLKYLETSQSEYKEIAYMIFQLYPAQLRNSGFRLPVDINGTERNLINELNKGPFVSSPGSECRITTSGDSETGFSAKFSCISDSSKTREIGDKEIVQVVNRLSDMVFSEEFVEAGKKTSLY